MHKHWRIRSQDAAEVSDFAKKLSVPHVVAQLLLGRGLQDCAQARMFLDAKLNQLRDPEDLPGVTAAVELLRQALADGRKIVIYGDYDVDGMTGTALLLRGLKMLGGQVSSYVPHRQGEGYGLNADAVQKLVDQGTKLLLTVDCGISGVEETQLARRQGVDVIVSDHHQSGPELPSAAAIVHPSLPGSTYPFAGLSGSGVALKLAWALCRKISGGKKVSDRLRDYLLQAVSLAALGTVADMVPLLDENRILVRHGLCSLREYAPLGLQHLMQVSGLADKPELESDDLAFQVAPRLNAAGRLGLANLGIDLLTTESPERAKELATYLDELNGQRKSLERSIYLQAHKLIQEQGDPEQEPALLVAERGWNSGVIGIVAGRLAEKYQRPVILVALDETGGLGSGSARSVPGFDLHAALHACGHHLVKYGGHAAAAGLTIEPERWEAFRAEFCEVAAQALEGNGRDAELVLDGEVPFAAFTLQTVEQLNQLAPFGQGNRRPVWFTSSVTLAEPPRKIGQGERHLSLKLRQHANVLRAVAWGQAEWEAELLAHSGPLEIAFQPKISHFRGRNVELELVDWRPARTSGRS